MGSGRKGGQRGHQSVVVDTTKSPHAKLRPLPLHAVRLNDDFWAPRLRQLQKVTLPTQYELMEETGRIDNFRYAAGKLKSSRGLSFLAPDSDVYKWLEAAAWSLAFEPDEKVNALIDRLIPEIAAAQDENGYLYTLFSHDRKRERWTNLRDMHELYCAGHLFQAAIAHHRVTREKALLHVALRFADHIAKTFGPDKKQEPDGHPEVEMALVELSRETDDQKYLGLAQFFIDRRGKGLIGGSPYLQDHKPFRELNEVTGHAVRALYLNCGATDLYAETGEKALLDALERMWHNLTQKRMYVTGGCGARYSGEAFGDDYELPNERAYAETCAAVANIFWNWRMLLITGDARFADTLELALFNGALSGIGLDGKSYFYVNPLADRGSHRRQPYYRTACCPPNLARLIALVPQFLYAQTDDTLFALLYATSTITLPFGETTLTLNQKTDYPWDGEVTLTLEPSRPITLTLCLRIPFWCTSAEIQVNGKRVGEEGPGRFFSLRREWQKGDTVTLSLPMHPEFWISHPFVEPNGGRVCIRRGPLVYCLEQADNPNADVWTIAAVTDKPLTARFLPDLLDGVVTIEGEGVTLPKEIWGQKLYSPLKGVDRNLKPLRFIAIPYFAWANRQGGPMIVWLPRFR